MGTFGYIVQAFATFATRFSFIFNVLLFRNNKAVSSATFFSFGQALANSPLFTVIFFNIFFNIYTVNTLDDYPTHILYEENFPVRYT